MNLIVYRLLQLLWFTAAYRLEFGALVVEFLHLNVELGFGLGQLHLLGRDDLDDPVVDVECSHPLADALARLGRVLPSQSLDLVL